MNANREPKNEPGEEAEVAQLRARIREAAKRAAHAAEQDAVGFAETLAIGALIAMLENTRIAKELTENEDEWLMRIRGAAQNADEK